MSITKDDIIEAMHAKFPGMEHYWISGLYSEEKFTKETIVASNGMKLKKPNLHVAHGGFMYCGCIDSLHNPIRTHVFKSITFNGLYRLIEAEDPNYIPDFNKIPQCKKRFKW